MAASSNSVSSGVIANWVELINEYLDKIPVQSLSEAEQVSSGLKILVDLWSSSSGQSETELRTAAAARRSIPNLDAALPNELAIDLKKKIHAIHELISEPDLYVEDQLHYQIFQDTLIDRIRSKINELKTVDEGQIAARMAEHQKSAEEAQQNRQLMQSRRAPSPHDAASTLSNSQAHWSFQYHQTLNDFAYINELPPFSTLEVDDILRDIGQRNNEEYADLLGNLCSLMGEDPELFQDHSNLLANIGLKNVVWPTILNKLQMSGVPLAPHQYPHSLVEIKTFLAEPEHQSFLRLVEVLDLSYTNLIVLPSEIGFMKGLTALILRNNQLRRLPDEMGQLRKLKLLDLSSNKLAGLPESLEQLSRLDVLYLNENPFEVFPAELIATATLNSFWNRLSSELGLDEADFDIEQVKAYLNNPEHHEQLAQVRKLNLSGANLPYLPAEIGLLTGLVELNLSANNLTGLPTEMSHLNQLRKLNLRYNPFDAFPDVIGVMPALTELNTKGNGNLMSVPVGVANTIALNRIWPMIAEQIGFTGTLRDANEIRAFLNHPENQPQLRRIKMLDLSIVDLELIPDELLHLSALHSLLLKPSCADLPLPVEVEELLSFNRVWSKIQAKLGLMEEMPSRAAINDYLDRLSPIQISELDLSGMQLKYLPRELFKLTELRTLKVHSNKIRALPRWIGNLQKLEVLDISGNPIETLPKEIGALKDLKQIVARRIFPLFVPRDQKQRLSRLILM